MTNIPFPNPHDTDALNNYLDDLAAGKQTNPENDVETAAMEFHQLASRAEVNPPTQQPIESTRGEETMHTATLAAPVSNRTRRQMQAAEKPGRSYGWLSAVIVAGLMISMIGSAWLNRDGGGEPEQNLAFAPGTSEAIDDVIITDAAPWIADFDPADCTETSGLQQVEIDYQSMPKADSQGYGIVGPAQAGDASAAVEQYRAMRGCETLTDAWAYWTNARINEHTRVISDQNRAELAELQAHYAENYPNQFMAIMNDLTISPEVEAEWFARQAAGIIGQPIPLEAKLNPDFAVQLSDGRIAFPATNIYSFDDPAIIAYGFPETTPASTVVMIFAKEDGSWKYDDSLALCLVNCENGVGNPLDPEEASWAQSPLEQTCTRQPMNPDVQDISNLNPEEIEYKDREYQPIGTPNAGEAAKAGETVTKWNNCGMLSGESSPETNSYMTPLGVLSFNMLANGGTDDPYVSASYLRQWETGSGQLIGSTSNWNQIVVLDEPVRSTSGTMTWTPMIDGSNPNTSTVRRMSQGFNPTTATHLSDGRLTIFTVPTIALEDRGAITYEGILAHQQIAGVTVQQHGDQWLVDELVMVNNSVSLHSESDAWWWDSAFNEPEIPWTQPVSFNECPEDAERNVYDPENPGGTMYSQEDYDQVSSERSYEIVGPASPEDAHAVETRMREAQGCVYMGKSTLKWTARFEYENRTTAGRESVEAIADERSEGGDSVSTWLEDEFGLTYQDVIVYQDPDELSLDGTESVINTRLYNPNLAVEFADGRIGLVPSIVTYEAISGQWDVNSVNGVEIQMQIFVYQDGEWMLDENLPMCIGDCSDLPYGTPMPGVDPMATPVETPTPVQPTPTHVPRGGDNQG